MQKKRVLFERAVQNWWCMYLNNSFAHVKLRSASYIQQKENNGREVLTAYFRIKLE